MFLSSVDFAEKIGVTPQTVREWDRRGIVIPMHRSITGIRHYTQEQVDAYLAGKYDSPILKGQVLNGVSNKKEVDSIPTRRVSYEEAMRDLRVWNELRELGFDINDSDEEVTAYDENEYLKNVSIAMKCLYDNEEIPKEVVDYMLKIKEIREKESGVLPNEGDVCYEDQIDC